MSDFPQTFTKAGAGGVLSPVSPVTPFGELSRMLGAGFNQAATAWGTANRAVYMPVMLSDPATIDRFLIQPGATVNGNVDVGIYSWENTLLVSSGAVAASGNAATGQTIDLTNTYLTPGWYKIASS